MAATKIRKQYNSQKTSAKMRGVPFLLTFEEWRGIWERSGKYHLRGRGQGRFVMARRGKRGPYSVDNVQIVTYVRKHGACEDHPANVHIDLHEPQQTHADGDMR